MTLSEIIVAVVKAPSMSVSKTGVAIASSTMD
jgi:hypothetical protein